MADSRANGTGVSNLLDNLGKRQQVIKANQMIFIWVAIASVIVVGCLVLSIFLVKKVMFNQKVINHKIVTLKIVRANKESAEKLKTNINKLLGSSALTSVKAKPEDSNLQVIFDALPTKGDTATLANSIYSRALQGTGATVDSISAGSNDLAVDPALAVDPNAQVTANTTGTSPVPQPVPFTTVIKGNQEAITNAIKNFERLLRPMDITLLTIKAGATDMEANIAGLTHYLGPDNVDLGKKPVRPK